MNGSRYRLDLLAEPHLQCTGGYARTQLPVNALPAWRHLLVRYPRREIELPHVNLQVIHEAEGEVLGENPRSVKQGKVDGVSEGR